MTAEPQHPMTLAAEIADAVAAQIQEVRDVLRSDAAAVGINIERVDAAVDTALATYSDTRVHGFIGVLATSDQHSAFGRAATPRPTPPREQRPRSSVARWSGNASASASSTRSSGQRRPRPARAKYPLLRS